MRSSSDQIVVYVIWKELHEVILNRRGLRGGFMNIAVIVLVFGCFLRCRQVRMVE